VSEHKGSLEEKISARLRPASAVRQALARVAGSPRIEAGSPRIEAADLLNLALDPDEPMEFRLDAVTILLAMERPDEEGLRKLLACGDRTVFIEALKSIKSFGVSWALRDLIVAANTTKEADRRAVLAWALAAYRDSVDAQKTLLDLATNDSSSLVREHATESLGEFRSNSVSKTLLHILAVGSSAERFWALFSLGNLADPSAADAVRGCLEDQTAVPGLGTISEEAEWALGKILAGG